jgi:carbonic anhydrase
MLWCMSLPRRSRRRTGRRPAVPTCEVLERRTVLNGSRVAAGMGAAILDHGPRRDHALESRSDGRPAPGTISGRVTNAAIGRGIKGIRVQLIDSSGRVVRTTSTNKWGQYRFRIAANGPYVVHEVTPRRLVQTSPTFVYTAPGSSPVSGKWNYSTGNTDPRNGAVGVYGWSSVAAAGNLPFQSPINISAPPINLSKYLTIDYNDTEAQQIVNSGHDIEVKIQRSGSDAIDVGGQPFELTRFHFHDPSEDQVYGTGYSMEEHFVNLSASGAVTVLAVFLQLGPYNPALQPILDAVSSDVPSPGTTTTSTPIHFAGLLPSSMRGWFYQGSLTAPPLAQPINWFVFATPITLSYAQLKQYEQVAQASGFLPNARPTQPMDGRRVNEFNYDVNFQNQSVAGLDFALARRPRA